MNEISCDVCMDLIPLVRDGVAAGGSREAVLRHIQTCDACRACCENAEPPCPDAEKALSATVRHVQRICVTVLAALVLLGIFLCEVVMQGSSLVFVLVVWVIICLFRVAFGGKKRGIVRRVAAVAVALALSAGILWAGNEVFGNPVSKAMAQTHIQGYLEGKYADSDYVQQQISYAASSATYEAEIRSESDPDLSFIIVYRDGKILYDTYEENYPEK